MESLRLRKDRARRVNQPELTSKTVKCRGAELLELLPQLQAEGWRVTTLIVNNAADYEVRAIRHWEKPNQGWQGISLPPRGA